MVLSDLININFDLLNVGIATAGICVLGFVVYFNNPRSITNKSFLLFSMMTILWGISNYLEYKFTTVGSALWALRIHLFISTWHAFAFFQLAYVFPFEKVIFRRWYRLFLLPIVVATSFLTLTPFVFSNIVALAPAGQVTNPERGDGIVLFTFVAFGLLVWGIANLVRKTIKFKNLERTQTAFILTGMFITACLILLFNVLLPVTFNNLSYIPFAAMFVFPFLALTSYTIYKHRLFNVRLIAISFVAFLLTIFSFINVVYSTTLPEVVLNITAFAVVLLGSIQLIRVMLALDEINSNQTNLMHIMNHQVKGRFGNAKNIFAELLTADYGEMPQATRPLLEKGLEETNLGVDYVQNILKGASAENGTLPYDMQKMDLKPVVHDVFFKLKPLAEKKGLKCTLDTTSGDYLMIGDKLQLGEAVRNLIDNSINYTQNGSINVKLSTTTYTIKFIVKDTGIGIDPKESTMLFKSGIRGANSLKINVNSTGYGLAFVKGVAEAHDGKVWVESDGVGKGSMFIMELPKQQ